MRQHKGKALTQNVSGQRRASVMEDQSDIQSAVLQQLARLDACSLDELVQALPAYSWNQIFSAVDRLSRAGKLTVRHTSRFDYLLSIGSRGAKNSPQGFQEGERT